MLLKYQDCIWRLISWRFSSHFQTKSFWEFETNIEFYSLNRCRMLSFFLHASLEEIVCVIFSQQNSNFWKHKLIDRRTVGDTHTECPLKSNRNIFPSDFSAQMTEWDSFKLHNLNLTKDKQRKKENCFLAPKAFSFFKPSPSLPCLVCTSENLFPPSCFSSNVSLQTLLLQ